MWHQAQFYSFNFVKYLMQVCLSSPYSHVKILNTSHQLIMIKTIQVLLAVLLITACNAAVETNKANAGVFIDTGNFKTPDNLSKNAIGQIRADTSPVKPASGTTPHQLVAFAKTLLGIPYKYASTDPTAGFDCSGYITYVFNHFGIKVPRSSIDFTNVGEEINWQQAKEGDLILFTGTVDSIRIVGHMGIVAENLDTLKFIHATSGRANGVTISTLQGYYEKRFIKVIRIM